MKRLIVIDGHAIMHRAYHALPPLTTSKGEIVNAVYGFISILFRTVEELKPTHIVVVFDTPKPTFRNKLSASYQATRPKTDEALIPQFERTHKVVDELGVLHFEMDGYEADDVIGTIANKCKMQNAKVKNIDNKLNIDETTEVIIVTGDKDLLQLVDEKIKVYMPVKGLSVSKLYSKDEVEEKLGVRPEKVIDLKALIGDQSDNYAGVVGIGPKTAADLLKSFGSFEGIYENLDKIKSATVRDKLVKGRKEGELSKKLATIVTNVPIDFDLETCKYESFDTAQVRWMLEELEFKSLIARLSGIVKNKEIEIKNISKEEKNNIQQTTLF